MNKDDTIAVIRSLLCSINSSYSIYNLNAAFKNATGVDIPLYGYNNVSDFLQSITDTVKVTGIYPIQKVSLVSNKKSAHIESLVQRQKSSQNSRKFNLRHNLGQQKSVEDTSYRNERLQKHRQFLRKTISECREMSYKSPNHILFFEPNLLPGDVETQNFMELGESIPYIHLSDHTQVGQYVEVCLCKIFNPYKFYFTFRKFKKQFSSFTKKLQIFYNYHDEIPNIRHETLKPNLICAAFYKIYTKSMWHRAEVLEILEDSHVLVTFIDEGYSGKILAEDLKYLHKDFRSFPRQACLGSLANIKPSKGDFDWSLSAIQRFYELSFQKELIAGVIFINSEDFYMNMTLTYTVGEEVHINDTLVTEGYAQFHPDELGIVNVTKNCMSGSRAGWKFSGNEINNTNITVPDSYISSQLRTPAFYLSRNYCDNKKLKKMFTAEVNT